MNVQELCKAMGNRERLKLLVCVQKPQSVSDLLARCALGQSALSQHLKVLRDSNLVTSSREGKQVIYKAASPQIVQTARQLLVFQDSLCKQKK